MDFELRLQVAGKFGRGTHALCLALRKVTSEHATIAVPTPILVLFRQRGRFLAWLAQRMSRVSALCCCRSLSDGLLLFFCIDLCNHVTISTSTPCLDVGLAIQSWTPMREEKKCFNAVNILNSRRVLNIHARCLASSSCMGAVVSISTIDSCPCSSDSPGPSLLTSGLLDCSERLLRPRFLKMKYRTAPRIARAASAAPMPIPALVPLDRPLCCVEGREVGSGSGVPVLELTAVADVIEILEDEELLVEGTVVLVAVQPSRGRVK
jgi:hypothetical protein